MAGKYNSESSDDDVKDRRDRYRRHSSKKVVESNNHLSRRHESDSSDSERRNISTRHEREDDRISDDKDRSRTNRKELVVKDEKRQNEHQKRKESRRSSDEDEKQLERERNRRDRTRTDRHEVGHRQREAVEGLRVRESNQGSGKDDKQLGRERERQERERTHQHEHGRRETEEEYEDKRVEEERGKRDRERESAHEPENGSRRKESKGSDKTKKSDQMSDEDDKRHEKKRGRREREGTHRHENGDKKRDTEGYRVKDHQHSLRDSEDGNRKSERQRDWKGDDNYWRHGHDYRREKKNEYRENEEHGRMKDDQSTVQVGNLNAGVPNMGKSGGVYIPPFKLARMMKEVEDKSSVDYQRLTWDALRKSINGLVNKVNATNIKNIIPELFAENLIRGRGLFCRSCMKSQMASPGFTDVFAALVAVVNTKFPEVGDLLLRRILLQLKRAYKRNDKPQLLAVVKFIAHLVNQQVAYEIIALELLTLLLEKPTDDSVEVAVGFVTECGSILQDLSPKGLHGIFERFRGILHEGEIDKRVQFLIEGLFAIRKAKFQGHPAVRPELDLVDQEDQLTHELSLAEEIDPEIALDIFKLDPQFLENEERYEELKKNIIGEESENEEGPDAGSEDEDDDSDDEDDDDEDDDEQMQIKDETETNLVNLRRTIYLTIMSSVDFEEAGHKLLKIKLEPGQEMELCIMLLECCSQERTYLRYYGLLGQRFCMINRVHQENFEKCFVQQYSMIHRLETNKLRNVAKFFAHLLGTDALPWHVLEYIRLTEEDTTSSSRIFIKILFQELSEQLGIHLLNERLSDPIMQSSFDSIFPKDNPKNTRFAINFFTSIGLGGITENLREYLKNMPRLIMQQQKTVSESDAESETSGSSGSDSESESSGSSSSDESDRDRRHSKRTKRG